MPWLNGSALVIFLWGQQWTTASKQLVNRWLALRVGKYDLVQASYRDIIHDSSLNTSPCYASVTKSAVWFSPYNNFNHMSFNWFFFFIRCIRRTECGIRFRKKCCLRIFFPFHISSLNSSQTPISCWNNESSDQLQGHSCITEHAHLYAAFKWGMWGLL